VSVLVVGGVLVVAVAGIAPPLVAGHGGARPSHAHVVAMPSWAAGLASKMFGSLTRPRPTRQAPRVIVPPLQAQGTTCYVAGGSVCSAKSLMPRVVPIRMP
jgi:hypothetical protein